MSLSAIWAASRDGIIGDGQGMPWHLPEDLAHFKECTQGSTVIMGRGTWESLPERFRPLPGRENIVVSSRAPGEWSRGALVVSSIDGLDGWNIGGGQLYASTIDLVDRVEVTEIDCTLAGVYDQPVFAPSLEGFAIVEKREWQESERGRLLGEESGRPLRYRFVSYRRKDAS
ncbi:dihydrofolate reductase [Corynebacterium tapiri]|uniref:dihydrofolate reductase n=1 Tax=Corynebacterium tapiri TaxID=1448266 RepID=A0A5C4U680_9CORY|nr:dihydrofolate reductase [Corynebacterium tapiri]TNM00402.1 dihydrofolate reductase [Corynebacterium tapiri]